MIILASYESLSSMDIIIVLEWSFELYNQEVGLILEAFPSRLSITNFLTKLTEYPLYAR